MAIELLTGLHPTHARAVVDENTVDEIPEILRRFHDTPGNDAVAREKRASTWPAKPATSPVWADDGIFYHLSAVATGCTRLQPKRRTLIRGPALQLLEGLLAHADGLDCWHSTCSGECYQEPSGSAIGEMLR